MTGVKTLLGTHSCMPWVTIVINKSKTQKRPHHKRCSLLLSEFLSPLPRKIRLQLPEQRRQQCVDTFDILITWRRDLGFGAFGNRMADD
tara:strand:- start:359 stop:625 length:267 start_codon:yes stop_codon:yes gene_type:complete